MFHEESEIEEWFEESKAALDKKFYKQSFKGSLEDGHDEYEKNMKRLVERYYKEHKNLEKRLAREGKLSAPKKRLLSWWKQRKKSFELMKYKKKKSLKKWWFNKKFDWMMRK